MNNYEHIFKPLNSFEDSETDECLFYETISGKYFWKPKELVILAEYELNKKFAVMGEVSLADFHKLLDLSPTRYSKKVGWSFDMGQGVYGYLWIDFVHKFIESRDEYLPSYYAITYPFPPTEDYLDY